MYSLRSKDKTFPGGFVWIDPLTTFRVEAMSYSNWLTNAIEHRVGNALPLPESAEMEDQLCQSVSEKSRQCLCIYTEGGIPVQILGVGGTLKQMLAYAGIHSCWSCSNLAFRMDEWGLDGCEENMADIVAEMNENANQRKWMRYIPFKEMGAEALVRMAISKVRNRV